MDKYEFNIKVEQIKKLTARGDFATAMKIADTIDWHRVRTVSLLSMAAQVYEQNGEYQEAKDILLMAYERAPIGKRLLYKLTDLALKEGSIEEAEAYYREFCEIVQDDPRQYLLRYQILKAKNAPVDQLIRALEAYASTEVDEKWLYELAQLYHAAGDGEACVAVCDKIMLLFGLGKYVDKAMDLKLEYAPLSKYQMDLVENRDKYEAKLRAVEEEYNNGSLYSGEYSAAREPEEAGAQPQVNLEQEAVMKLREEAQSQQLAQEMSRLAGEETPAADAGRDDPDATRLLKDLHELKDIKPTKRVLDAAAERAAAGTAGAVGAAGAAGIAAAAGASGIAAAAGVSEAAGIAGAVGAAAVSGAEADESEDSYDPENSRDDAGGTAATQEAEAQAKAIRAAREEAAHRAEKEREIERQRNAIRAAKEREEMEEEALRRAEEEREAARRAEEERRAKKQAEIDRERAQNSQVRSIAAPEDEEPEPENLDIEVNNLMIEADSPEEGLSVALDALRELHRELGYKNPVAKIDSEKLNRRGISSLAAKLAGKDLVIEHAAGLTTALQNELDELMERDKSGMIVVLIDSKERLEELHARNMSLAEKFQYIAADENAGEQENAEAAAEKKPRESRRAAPEAEEAGRLREPLDEEKEAGELREPFDEAEESGEPQEPDHGEDELSAREEMRRAAARHERARREAEAREREERNRYESDSDEEEPEDGFADDGYEEEPKKKGLFHFGKKKAKRQEDEETVEAENADGEDGRYGEEPDAPRRTAAEKPEGTAAAEAASTAEADGRKEEPQADEAVPEDYDDGSEMDLDEFAQYACKYAADIDCSITGKSLLALYERIEMMEEDGVRLTKREAVDLIEEAADKAENPSLGRKLTGLFSAKYDKEGALILHENDFFD